MSGRKKRPAAEAPSHGAEAQPEQRHGGDREKAAAKAARRNNRRATDPIEIRPDARRFKDARDNYNRSNNILSLWSVFRDIQRQVGMNKEFLHAETNKERQAVLERMEIGPFPGWFIMYFCHVASVMRSLERRLDPNGGWSPYSGEPAPPMISAQEATQHLLHALEIQSPGRNAFDLHWRGEEASWAIYAHVEDLKERGLSPRDAREQAMEYFGIADERTVRRMIARVAAKKPKRKAAPKRKKPGKTGKTSP